jgi:hypothetical protein
MNDLILRANSMLAMIHGLYPLGLIPGPTAPLQFTSSYLQGTDKNGNEWFIVHSNGTTGKVMVPQRNPVGWTSNAGVWTPNGPVVTSGTPPATVMQAYDTGFWCVMRWLGATLPTMPVGIVVQAPATLNPDVMAGLTQIA